MRCSERRRAVAVAIDASRGRIAPRTNATIMKRNTIATVVGFVGSGLITLIAVSSGGREPNAATAGKNAGQIAVVSFFFVFVVTRFILSFIPFASDPKASAQSDTERAEKKKWTTTAAVSGPVALIAGYIMVSSVQANANPGASVGGFVAFCAAFGRKEE
jgi:hypothetical protein